MVEAIQYVFIFFMFSALISRASARPKVVILNKASEETPLEIKNIIENTQERVEPIVPSRDDFNIDTLDDFNATDDSRIAKMMSEVLDLKKGNKPMAVRVNPYREIFGLQAIRRQLINRLNDACRCPRVISN